MRKPAIQKDVPDDKAFPNPVIFDAAPTLEALKKLPIETKSWVLLARLFKMGRTTPARWKRYVHQEAFQLRAPFCSSPGCHCKANPPIKHGPYNQLSFTRKGKSSTKFIRDKHLSDVKKQVSNYQTMKMLVDQWIDLATELSDLRMTEDWG